MVVHTRCYLSYCCTPLVCTCLNAEYIWICVAAMTEAIRDTTSLTSGATHKHIRTHIYKHHTLTERKRRSAHEAQTLFGLNNDEQWTWHYFGVVNTEQETWWLRRSMINTIQYAPSRFSFSLPLSRTHSTSHSHWQLNAKKNEFIDFLIHTLSIVALCVHT